MKIVMVEWTDSSFLFGWHNKQSLKEEHVSECCTVGILIKENNKEMTVCQSHSPENFATAIVIPKVNVKRIRTLKVGY
jgi:hypothetical protein